MAELWHALEPPHNGVITSRLLVLNTTDVHTLTFEASELNAHEVERVRAQLYAAVRDHNARVVLDLSRVDTLRADGLSALIELLARRGPVEIALHGLGKVLTHAAIDTDLAELAELSVRPPRSRQLDAEKRWVVVHEVPHAVGIGFTDVAGRPLIVRQLQWLRDQGLEDVIVEVCSGSHARARGAFLLSDDPLVSRVVVVPTAVPSGPKDVGRRAGLSASALRIELASTALPLGDLRALLDASAPLSLTFDPPTAVRARPAVVTLRTGRESERVVAQKGNGVGVSVEGVEVAHALAIAALSGDADGVLVHGSPHESQAQLWYSRGARIEPGAKVEPPIYLGAGTLIMSGAEVGPNAVIGDGTVVANNAVVANASICGGVIVGESVRVRNAYADQLGLVEFSDDKRISIVDELVLSPVERRTPKFMSRISAALFVCVLFVPWLVGGLYAALRGTPFWRTIERRDGRRWHVGALGWRVIDAVPALCDVVLGTRDLVGVAVPEALEIVARRRELLLELRAGAIEIAGSLSPNHRLDTLMRMWRWYAPRKCAQLDKMLLNGARRWP